jgi:hypothetical protein
MWEDKKNPMLVYATEDAVETLPLPLPPTLERFVKADNKTFQQELSREQEQEQEQEQELSRESDVAAAVTEGSVERLSPSKRKHRSDSLDSMNTNRASFGGSESGMVEDPFIDDHGAQMSHYSASSNTMDVDRGMDDVPPLLDQTPPGSVKADSATIPDELTVTGPATPEEEKKPEMEQKAGMSPFVTIPETRQCRD